jgi:ComF family protein
MPTKVYSWPDAVCSWLLPPCCVLCGGRGQFPGLDICSACEGDLPGPSIVADLATHDARAVAASPPIPAVDLSPCDRWFAAFAYAPPVDFLVQALKYRAQLATGRVLGVLLGAAVLRHGVHLDVDVVVPVPLHPARHAERGFNQSAELGRWVARGVGRRFCEGAVSRVRDTRRQVGLHLDERRTNLTGAFACGPSLRGLRVAVVDDVLTTGSTARAMAVTLRDAGVASIDLWCVAHAEPPRLRHTPDAPGNPAAG